MFFSFRSSILLLYPRDSISPVLLYSLSFSGRLRGQEVGLRLDIERTFARTARFPHIFFFLWRIFLRIVALLFCSFSSFFLFLVVDSISFLFQQILDIAKGSGLLGFFLSEGAPACLVLDRFLLSSWGGPPP